eukprot:scaffold220996_cov29-Tisochrysis_lutea.AAC.2
MAQRCECIPHPALIHEPPRLVKPRGVCLSKRRNLGGVVFMRVPILDVIALCGYKFLGAVVTLAASLAGGLTGRWASTVLCSLCIGTFVVKTLRSIARPAGFTPGFLTEGMGSPGKRAQKQTYLLWGAESRRTWGGHDRCLGQPMAYPLGPNGRKTGSAAGMQVRALARGSVGSGRIPAPYHREAARTGRRQTGTGVSLPVEQRVQPVKVPCTSEWCSGGERMLYRRA